MGRIITKLWLVSAFECWIPLIFTEELIEAKAAENILLICSCGNWYSTKESNKVKHIAEL